MYCSLEIAISLNFHDNKWKDSVLKKNPGQNLNI